MFSSMKAPSLEGLSTADSWYNLQYQLAILKTPEEQDMKAYITGGPQYKLQYTMIQTVGTPKKRTLISTNLNIERLTYRTANGVKCISLKPVAPSIPGRAIRPRGSISRSKSA